MNQSGTLQNFSSFEQLLFHTEEYGLNVCLNELKFCKVSQIPKSNRCWNFLYTNALSFYRSQNVLCRSQFFVSDQKLIYILCQPQTFFAKQKDGLHLVKLFFVLTPFFEEAQNADKFLGWLKKFRPAQNILWLVKGH